MGHTQAVGKARLAHRGALLQNPHNSRADLPAGRKRRAGRLNQLKIEDLRYHGWGPIDLTIDAAECVCLAGPSGSGKTLLLRAIADLDPHSGSIGLGASSSEEITPCEWRRRVGFLPAESQWWRDRVADHFGELAEAQLAELGFPRDVMDWEVSRLSTGERQRLALARLLANRPQALLLDEPTASLDPENVTRVERLIATYQRETGAPALWITHDPQQLRRVGARGYRMAAGRIVAQVHP
jgi:ABC-type iron transport system FetAB ATPase subunit